ncbi:MAG: hypothetical protein K1X74_19615 [Pirellulales bacterium]|nr:hypothetical protein [Pirellulales bacterium]
MNTAAASPMLDIQHEKKLQRIDKASQETITASGVDEWPPTTGAIS